VCACVYLRGREILFVCVRESECVCVYVFCERECMLERERVCVLVCVNVYVVCV